MACAYRSAAGRRGAESPVSAVAGAWVLEAILKAALPVPGAAPTATSGANPIGENGRLLQGRAHQVSRCRKVIFRGSGARRGIGKRLVARPWPPRPQMFLHLRLDQVEGEIFPALVDFELGQGESCLEFSTDLEQGIYEHLGVVSTGRPRSTIPFLLQLSLRPHLPPPRAASSTPKTSSFSSQIPTTPRDVGNQDRTGGS